MRHWTPKRTETGDSGHQVRVARSDGGAVPARLRLLGYEGCEFESDQPFAPGEEVAIHIPRMGRIRARVRWSEQGVVEVEFVHESPV